MQPKTISPGEHPPHRARWPMFVSLALVLTTVLLATRWVGLAAGPGPKPAVDQIPAKPTGTTATETYTVNAPDDTDDGDCDEIHCSLREAIAAANNHHGKDNIAFDIPGPGPHTIRPLAALPIITGSVIIDGYTQPGAITNTNSITLGLNTVLKIELDGSHVNTSTYGLRVEAGRTTVRGLAINRFLYGIDLWDSGSNVIQGNFIGTDISGTTALPNFMGVRVVGENATNNLVGSTTPDGCNLIAGNSSNGVSIEATGTDVIGNIIGKDVTGGTALPNVYFAVRADRSEYTTISGNVSGAIYLEDSGHSTVASNTVSSGWDGITVSGVNPSPPVVSTSIISNYVTLNAESGIVQRRATNTTIAGNTVTLNGKEGIHLESVSASFIHGNFIGTVIPVSGTALLPPVSLGNTSHGLVIVDGYQNEVGGTKDATGNIIAFNGGDGVRVLSGRSNSLLSNRIFGNHGLGINLGNDGVTSNDPGDGDDGANRFQNFPVITAAGRRVITGTTWYTATAVTTTLDSAPSTTFSIQLFANDACDPSGYGEGQSYLGSVEATTNYSGFVRFVAIITGTQTPTDLVWVATATNSNGDTSEFSHCLLPRSVYLPGVARGWVIVEAHAHSSPELYDPARWQAHPRSHPLLAGSDWDGGWAGARGHRPGR